MTSLPFHTLAVVAYPRMRKLDEFEPLHGAAGVRLVWARSPADVARADCVVLPGSDDIDGDLAWLRRHGLDSAVARHAADGGAVLGICAGLRMLGEALIDPQRIAGNGPGLGLLPLVTVQPPDSELARLDATFGVLHGAWSALSHLHVRGCEADACQVAQHQAMEPAVAVMDDGLAWQNARGNVLGVCLHRLFDDPGVLRALFGPA